MNYTFKNITDMLIDKQCPLVGTGGCPDNRIFVIGEIEINCISTGCQWDMTTIRFHIWD